MMLAGAILTAMCLSGCSTLPLWVDEIIVEAYEAE